MFANNSEICFSIQTERQGMPGNSEKNFVCKIQLYYPLIITLILIFTVINPRYVLLTDKSYVFEQHLASSYQCIVLFTETHFYSYKYNTFVSTLRNKAIEV